jgi:arsenical pump membrane protein
VSGALALVLALVLLGLTLAVAVVRPTQVPEAAVAAAGALVLVVVGALSWHQADAAIRQLGPTVGFLAALLLIAEGCRREGLFRAIGELIAHRAGGRSVRLLALVFTVASLVTIVLGLDATVVLLPPIVLVTVRRLRADPRAPLYACAHLANSASLLLPVSNLTNLLAFHASGLSFARFAVLMSLSTVAAVGVEWVVLSRRFGVAGERLVAIEPSGAGTHDDSPGSARTQDDRAGSGRMPRFPLIVLALTLLGFALSSALGVAPVWIAVAGAVVLNLPTVAHDPRAAAGCVRAAEPGFLVFVLGLGVIVAAAGEHGLGGAVRDLLPSGASLPDLLLSAVIAALLANLVNNLPATLILLPVAAGLGTGPVLAVLVGVNIGPNLTPVGSLATLLWRRVLRTAGVELPTGEFLWLGVLTVPAGLLLATAGVWVMLRLGV